MSSPLVRLTTSKSPVKADTVALSGLAFGDLCSNQDAVYIGCRDPAHAGKSHVQSLNVNNENKVVTPFENNVRSAVHEYGGGGFVANGDDDDLIVFTDFPSHSVYSCKSGNNKPKVVLQKKNCRFANFYIVNGTETMIAIMEDHSNPKDVQNSVVSFSLIGGPDQQVTVLASGHDFYACPQVNPAQTKLAFVAWDHPSMPWDDDCILYSQDFANQNNNKPVVIQRDASLCEPRWYDNDKLCFISNKSGWSNLYLHDLATSKTTCLLPKQADFVSGGQGWILGLTPYTIMEDGTIVACYTPKGEAGAKLVLITLNDNDGTVEQAQEFGRSCLPPKTISSLVATRSNGLYFVGGSTTDPPAIWHWQRPGDEACVATKVLDSMDGCSVDLSAIQNVMSEPKLIEYPSGDGVAHGYYYPPSPKLFTSNPAIKPPLLVKAHGGPTSRTSTTFRLDVAYWTSRGFAILDVDYRGSTGYGRDYQHELDGKWGIVDVQDVCAGAQYCVDQEWVNPDWLCIDGRSAGGYTTLAALTFAKTFRAGASLYGISDLVALCADTHKFESRYMEGLVGGKYPENEESYKERSPIHYTDKLDCPILLLQGDEDKVVPPNQAELMYRVLKDKGLSTSLVIYKGEQHGFRKPENVRHALCSEYNFFCQVFGIEAEREDGFGGITIGEKLMQ